MNKSHQITNNQFYILFIKKANLLSYNDMESSGDKIFEMRSSYYFSVLKMQKANLELHIPGKI